MSKIRLDEVCEKGSSNIAQKDLENNNGQYPIYGASGLIKYVDFYKQDKEYIAIVKDGAGVGRTMLLPEKSSVIGTMQYIFPKANVDTRFLYYAITYMGLSKYYTGAAIPHIYFKDYQNEKLNFYEMEQQRKIADKLDSVERVIQQHKELLEIHDDTIKSRFAEMFGDTVINSMSWEEHRLDEYIVFLTSGSRGWSKHFVDTENELFITIKNVKNNHITLDNIQYVDAPANKEAERTKVKAGDLLISITADLGRTGVVDENIASMGAYINQHLSLVRLDDKKIKSLYVSYFLETEGGKIQFETKNQKGVKAGLNFDAIRSLKILVPPIEKQNTYIEFVKQVEKAKTVIKEQLEELETLKKSLMQKYFG